MIYQVLFTLTTLLIASFLCRPFNFNWDKNIKGTCGNQTAAYISISALDIFGDVLIIGKMSTYPWNEASLTIASTTNALALAAQNFKLEQSRSQSRLRHGSCRHRSSLSTYRLPPTNLLRLPCRHDVGSLIRIPLVPHRTLPRRNSRMRRNPTTRIPVLLLRRQIP